MAGLYTAREVEWLLSITHAQAVAVDADARSSFPDLLSNPEHVASASDDRDLLTVLRWDDVDGARRRIQGRIDQRVTVLHQAGLDQAEIGQVIGRSQQAVSRRFRASIAEIVAELTRRTS